MVYIDKHEEEEEKKGKAEDEQFRKMSEDFWLIERIASFHLREKILADKIIPSLHLFPYSQVFF